MASSLNKIMLIGNLGKDAENSFTPKNNVPVTTFTMATTHSYKNVDGNWQDETTWHNIKAFKLSDYMRENLKKGKKVYVEGRLTKRDYEDKQNIKRSFWEVLAERIMLLEFDRSNSGYSNNGSSTGIKEETAAPDVSTTDQEDDLPF